MERIIYRTLSFILVITALSFFCSTETRAQTGTTARTHWGIARVQGIITLPVGNDHAEIYNDCGDSWLDFLDFSASVNVNTSGGIMGSFEYVLARRYGIEVGLNWWRHIVDLKFETEDLTIEGVPNFIYPTLGFNYHFLTDSRTDLYAGVLACLGVAASGTGADIDVSKSLAFGMNLGFDYYLSGTWFIGGTVKYIDFGQMEFSLLPAGLSGIICGNGLFGIGDLNTISLTCGAGYRF